MEPTIYEVVVWCVLAVAVVGVSLWQIGKAETRDSASDEWINRHVKGKK